MELRDFADAWNGRIDPGTALRRNYPILVFLLLAVLLAIGLLTSFYRVDASDEGVVLRFGRHVRTASPGLHWKWPWPIEEVYQVPVRRVQVLEFGFRTERPGRVTVYAPTGPDELNVSEMLTGDLNLANVEWVVQYRVNDPFAYLFSLGDVERISADALPSGALYDPNIAVPDTIRDVSESVMRKLVGDTSVDSVLTLGREQIAADAKLEIQSLLDEFDAGLEIVTVKMQSTSPPEEVRDAFQEVNRARQNKERVVNEAEGERNRQIPAARGKRDKVISEAEGYAERIKLETEGKVNAYLAQLEEYEKAPEVTRTRIYLDAMEQILGQAGQTTILDDSVTGLLPLLNLDPDASRTSPAKGAAQ